MDMIMDIFDTTSSDNCCNCISIVLYSTELLDCLNTFKYLTNILGTLNNVKKYLKDYIVRLYLDKSVLECIYETIKKYYVDTSRITPDISDTIKSSSYRTEYSEGTSSEYGGVSGAGAGAKTGISEDDKSLFNKTIISYKEYSLLLARLMNYIINHPICEIHMKFCSKEKTPNLHETRGYRFNGFYDPTVNINISREADGIVTLMDCYNIIKFESTNYIGFIYNAEYLHNFKIFINNNDYNVYKTQDLEY